MPGLLGPSVYRVVEAISQEDLTGCRARVSAGAASFIAALFSNFERRIRERRLSIASVRY
jgi:hypothetical protein